MDSSESALNEFFSECDEILQRFSTKLAMAEKGGADANTISALYRDMHTLKGSSQLFGFQVIAQVAHAMETALEPFRRLKIQIPPALLDALFKSIDLIERIVKESALAKKEAAGPFDEEAKAVVPKLLAATADYFESEFVLPSDKVINIEITSALDPLQASQMTPQNQVKTQIMQMNDSKPEHSTQDSKVVASIQNPKSEPQPTATPGPGGGGALKESKEGGEANDANSTVRIQVGLLDSLMNLVGEMVLIRNQMLQYGQKHDALEFLNLSQRLDVVTSDLQGEVMKTRMQPISSILSKFQRVVRDLSRDLSKQIDFTVEGAETELDKTLLEAIKDPLTHIIRNSCDHGLETPDERKGSGKNPLGRIHVRAFHEGGHVILEIIDDGRGLNTKRILAKALEKKILSDEQASKLSDREVMQLIFAPGFSTAEQVTAVSGRGVGMDVVKTNLERIGGQVELQSALGRGTTVRLRIPLTLAIVPALIIRSNGEQFAIPQIKLSELVRVENDTNGPKIEKLQGHSVFRLRGQLVSLVSLREVLGLSQEHEDAVGASSVNIVILNDQGETFGLMVDEIRDTADIVVKPLSNFLKRLQVYSGATIMGDGSVSLILDVSGVADRAHVSLKNSKRDLSADVGLSAKSKKANMDQQDFLFFRLNSDEKYCLPLCLVQRLEELPLVDVQQSGKQRIVKYRGSILPIVSLNEYFNLNLKSKGESASASANDKTSVIVVSRNSRQFGIEVNEVVDILSVSRNIEDPVRETKGIWGSIIIENQVATVIDVYAILDSIIGKVEGTEKSKDSAKSISDSKRKTAKILLAEDTVFFMKQVKKILEQFGHTVVHAPDGEQAWQMLSNAKPGEFQLLLSDIEMPNMDGFQLAEAVRKDERHSKTPMIALTTRFREADRDRGRNVGFNRYLEKLKSDELITAIQEVLGGQGNG